VRRLIATTLKTWGVDEQDPASSARDALVLIASELSTNSVKATGEDFTVVMTTHRTYVEICVKDRAPASARQMPAWLADSGGRGLAIVAALSCQWGQEPFDGACKKVWSRVPVPEGSRLAWHCTL
jgi:hypothetical protein